MPDEILSENEANRIITLQKRLSELIRWQERDGNYIMDLPIEVEEQLPLRLYGRYNPRTNNFNFILFFNKFRIRALDVGKRHHNPECDNIGTVHLHQWTDGNRDKWAFEPPDFPGTPTIGAAFRRFLVVCNISYDGSFVSPPQGYQRGF